MELQSFDQLSTRTLYEILQLRSAVFVAEQDCNYLDPDGVDLSAYHLFKRIDGNIVCYARLYESKKEAHIGRVLTPSEARGKGYGIELMKAAVDNCKVLFPNKDIVISAQEYLLRFYEGFGFVVEGTRYFEDNLPHFKMRIKLT